MSLPSPSTAPRDQNGDGNSDGDGVIPFGTTVIHSDRVNLSTPILYSNLRDKTIVITGGASGFGATCFRAWASDGANVIIGDINSTKGTELVAAVRQATGNSHLHFLPLDVTSWASQAAFFKQAAELSPHGGIDCVVANAGIADAKENAAFEEPPDYEHYQHSPSDADGETAPQAPSLKTLDVNLYGLIYTAHLALSYLARNPDSQACNVQTPAAPRDRHLLLVSSIAGLAGLPSQPLYAAAKHGVVGLFRTLRLITPIKHGIRVNMINPYFVDTPILGTLGSLVLAGGGMATIDSVLDATTRLVADQGIIGRALVIGPKTAAEHARIVGLELDAADQAVWDVHADDFEQSDLFTRRIIGVTNLVTRARGWAGVATDIANKASSGFWRALGY
ncbi:hypothetical protein A1O3_07490 [Capronia epimyces CBS 606.96]|uniref:Alcohol dehydrogenase n=1 Tax=Capronia epimyces CBS 606.96 TaxID=1182542 RepID=W9XV15_9EURO|nr:uncharacterized protein A1O3_07490 [Capronia epimyces CBS 606.96]EXJ81200.1 hypothetical protein A1O3_07490 [Capronia epimyces CBS 606.96]